MSLITRILLVGVAGVLFIGGSYLTNREQIRALEKKVATAEAELERVQIDHRDTLDAINKAMTAREAVHAQASFCERRMREALAENQDLASLPLSDSLWMCLQWPDEDGEMATTPSAAGRDPHPGSQGSTNSR